VINSGVLATVVAGIDTGSREGMANPIGRRAVAAAVAILAVGFGGGFLTAKLVSPRVASPGVTAANGFAWPFFGQLRAADAPRAAPKKPDGFAVWTTRFDVQPAGPRACISMSRPLDPRRSYGDFVTVSPDLGHPAAVTVQGDELCVSGVGYESRTITLVKGLPAADGEVLGANVDVAVEAGSKPVYVGFSGSGVILPREDADGVGLETVNVSRIHIEVWRVADRNLVRKQISAPDPTPEGGFDYDGGEDGVGDDGRKIWAGDMPVQGQPDQRAVTVFPLGAVLKTLEPGAYVVTVADASGVRGTPTQNGEAEGDSPARARRWILFTDMALQAYDGSDALDVTVRSLKTARPMAGVRMALVGKDGGEVAAVNSDGSGRAHFARAMLAGENGAAPAEFMAYGPQGDFTVLDLSRAPIDLSKQDVGGRTVPGGAPASGKAALDPAATVDGFVYADRGVYRPGESVHLVALLRDRLAHAVKDRRGSLVIRRPSGLEFSRVRFASTPTGAVADDAILPADAPRGVWKASLEMEGSDNASGEVTFEVEDFAPQRLAVTLAGDADRPIVAGEHRAVQVQARFLYGAIGSGLAVKSDARIAVDPNPFPAFKDYSWGDQQSPFAEKLIEEPGSTTDAAGHATQVLTTDALGGSAEPLQATFSASVFEPGGRPVTEQANLKIRLKPLYLGVKTTAGSGDEPVQTFEVIAVDAFGRRIAAPKVSYKLIAENWNYDWYEQGGQWAWRRTNRDIPIAAGFLNVGAGAPARLARKLPWGDYRLELDDMTTGAHAVIRQSSGWPEPTDGTEPPDSARLSAMRTGYHTGDTVAVRIDAPFAGEAEVVVASDRLIDSKFVNVPKGGTTVRFKANGEWGGGAYVLATVVQPRDPVASPKPRRALGLVYVPLEPSGQKLTVALQAPPILDSKAAVQVPLVVKGLGFGETAHVTLAAVDEGILRVTHQQNPDPIAWYFGKRALSLAYRDDYGRLLDPNLGPAGAVNFGGDEVGGGSSLTAVPIKTVALWSGVVTTDAGGHATVHLPPGDFNGQLRLVAVAWTDKAVGSGSADVTVRQPVVAELALPRFLAPGDRAQATLELDNLAGQPGAYRAGIVAAGGYGVQAEQGSVLARGQRIAQSFAILAPRGPVVGSLDLRTTGPGFTSDQRYPLQTRLGWGPVTHAMTQLQNPGESYTPPASTIGGFANGVTLTVSYSPFRNFDPAPIATALSRYPYGCSEQLVSTAFPLLYAPEVGGTPKLRAPTAALASAVGKLLDREALDGSFGLWRVGDGEADPWLGAYIVDFLQAARAQGVAVPDEAMNRALSAMRLVSKPDGFSSVGYQMDSPYGQGKQQQAENQRRRSRAAAYALYDLAKAGKGDLARLRWFHDVGFQTEQSPLARAQIGAALAAMGDRARAHDSFVQALATLGYRDDNDEYQSPLRDLAGVVALAYEAGETGIAHNLQGRLENTVVAPDALNTQEQAELLKAAHAMLAAAGPVNIQASGVQPLGGAGFAVGRLASAKFVNLGHGAIWRTVTVSGLPTTPPHSGGAGLRLEEHLYHLDGSAADPASLKQGDRLIVRLSGAAAAKRPTLTVIDDALPAGLEIEALLGPADAQGAANDNDGGKAAAGRFAFLGPLTDPQVQEMRDDRYVGALTLADGKPFALAYVARAVTPGDFFLPGAEARDMYHPAVNAHTAPGRLKIAAAR
jgi:uncharacterized protein YfaS (alpha-2-macroglobulin family)